jgi:hypothetical protein
MLFFNKKWWRSGGFKAGERVDKVVVGGVAICVRNRSPANRCLTTIYERNRQEMPQLVAPMF